jgi:hypothetical protein
MTHPPGTEAGLPTASSPAPMVYLLAGLTGSGKTTFAKTLEAAGVVRLSVDEDVFARHGRHGIDYPEHEYPAGERPIVEHTRQRLVEPSSPDTAWCSTTGSGAAVNARTTNGSWKRRWPLAPAVLPRRPRRTVTPPDRTQPPPRRQRPHRHRCHPRRVHRPVRTPQRLSRRDHPAIDPYARHIGLAQGFGLPSRLSHLVNTDLADLNRSVACTDPQRRPRPTGFECDEYPFASTGRARRSSRRAAVGPSLSSAASTYPGRSSAARCRGSRHSGPATAAASAPA